MSPQQVIGVLVVLGIATSTQAGSKCLTVEVIKSDRMFPGTTAFIDNSGFSSRIVECDAEGNTVWDYELPSRIQPQSKFTNDLEWVSGQNHFLFTSRGNGVFEVDRNKSIVWSYATDKASHDADRLPNGNTLFVWGGDGDNDAQITEVSPIGDVVWQWAGKQYLANDQRHEIARREPYSYTHANAVRRLASGNTLVSLRNFHMVAEISPNGDIVSKQNGLPKVHDPYVLPNGNLLVSLLVRPGFFPIREVTRSGEIVWEYVEPGFLATTVERLPNGNILLAGTNKIIEMTSEKEVVWSATLPDVSPEISNQQKHLYKVVRIPLQR